MISRPTLYLPPYTVVRTHAVAFSIARYFQSASAPRTTDRREQIYIQCNATRPWLLLGSLSANSGGAPMISYRHETAVFFIPFPYTLHSGMFTCVKDGSIVVLPYVATGPIVRRLMCTANARATRKNHPPTRNSWDSFRLLFTTENARVVGGGTTSARCPRIKDAARFFSTN